MRGKSEDSICRQLSLQGEGNARHSGTATSTQAGLQAAQRSTPASWSPLAQTCGNRRGEAGREMGPSPIGPLWRRASPRANRCAQRCRYSAHDCARRLGAL